jgi:hypothetical protein
MSIPRWTLPTKPPRPGASLGGGVRVPTPTPVRPPATQQLPPSRTTPTTTTPTYTPWTGGGNDGWMGAPGDQGNVEYGVNRTRASSGTRPVDNIGPSTPPPVQQPQIRDWRDAAYNSQIAAIQRALQDFETGAQTRGERYGQDFMTGLSRLGYRPAEGFQAMPNVLEALAQQEGAPMARMAGMAEDGAAAVAVPAMSGMFDIEGQFDPFSAAARGTRGMRDEFAGRGTLRSSDFARTFGEFQNRLNQQLEAMETGRTRFGQDLATEVAQQRAQAEERRQAAMRDAQQRAIMESLAMAGF